MLSKGDIWLFEHYLPLVNYLAFYPVFCLPHVLNVPHIFFKPITLLKPKLWSVTCSNRYPSPSLEDEPFSRYTDINPSLSFSSSSSHSSPGVWRRGESSLPTWLLSTSDHTFSIASYHPSALCSVPSCQWEKTTLHYQGATNNSEKCII